MNNENAIIEQINRLVIDSLDKVPTDSDNYYNELISRNQHFISCEVQTKIRSLKVFVGGCGTVGGACLEPLARLGVENFMLADNGVYELSNLNRQCAYIENIGENKAIYNKKLLQGVNPFIKAKTFPEGVTPDNVQELVDWADLIIDAVDVTSQESINAKLSLHEYAKTAKKPVFSAMDPGFCQCGIGFDYRKETVKILNGQITAARSAKHPFKAWFYILPVSLIPTHCLPLIVELLEGKTTVGSQITVSSNLLSAIIVSCIVRFVDDDVVIRKWNVNLDYIALPFKKRFFMAFQRPFLLSRINKLIAELP